MGTVELIAGPAGTLALGAGVVTWLVREVKRLQAELAQEREQRRADWRAQAEMNLTNQRALDKATLVMERLAGKKLSPTPTSYRLQGPGGSST